MTPSTWEEAFARNRILGLFYWLQSMDEALARRDAAGCGRLLEQVLDVGRLSAWEQRPVLTRECAFRLLLGGGIEPLSGLLSARAQACRGAGDLGGAAEFLYRLGLARCRFDRMSEGRLLLAQSRELATAGGNVPVASAGAVALAAVETGPANLEGLWHRDMLGGEAPLELLSASVEDADWRRRREAMLALVEVGETAPLVRCLQSANVLVRMDAAAALEKACDPRTVEPLIQALKDEHWFVRWRAAVALGEIGDWRARIALEDALADPDPEVLTSALEALGRTGDQNSLRFLRVVRDVQDSAGHNARSIAAVASALIQKRTGGS